MIWWAVLFVLYCLVASAIFNHLTDVEKIYEHAFVQDHPVIANIYITTGCVLWPITLVWGLIESRNK